eukprot:scaffold215568_cov31-Tisochrysis_lutea.AAC.2
MFAGLESAVVSRPARRLDRPRSRRPAVAGRRDISPWWLAGRAKPSLYCYDFHMPALTPHLEQSEYGCRDDNRRPGSNVDASIPDRGRSGLAAERERHSLPVCLCIRGSV